MGVLFIFLLGCNRTLCCHAWSGGFGLWCALCEVSVEGFPGPQLHPKNLAKKNSTQKKGPRIYSRTENLCHSARLVPYHHTEELKGRGTEGRHPTISELDQVSISWLYPSLVSAPLNSPSAIANIFGGIIIYAAAASAGTVLAHNRKSVSCSLFLWELLVYALVDVELFLYEIIRN